MLNVEFYRLYNGLWARNLMLSFCHKFLQFSQKFTAFFFAIFCYFCHDFLLFLVILSVLKVLCWITWYWIRSKVNRHQVHLVQMCMSVTLRRMCATCSLAGRSTKRNNDCRDARTVCLWSAATQWVSSFLTAHQHKIGHSVPYVVKIN